MALAVLPDAGVEDAHDAALDVVHVLSRVMGVRAVEAVWGWNDPGLHSDHMKLACASNFEAGTHAHARTLNEW